MTDDKSDCLLERIALALESIAGSLVKLANPQLVAEEDEKGDIRLKPYLRNYVSDYWSEPTRDTRPRAEGGKRWNFVARKWEDA